MPSPSLVPFRDDPSAQAAVVFVHGFGGDSTKTWGQFPDLLTQQKPLNGWNLYSLGYQSNPLMPDLRGLWSSNADITQLAGLLRTHLDLPPLAGRKALALVAHSMGGLVVQRALLDAPELQKRVGHVAMFGTPSGGLGKARWPFGWFKQQVADMAAGGPFVTTLRQQWERSFGRGAPAGFRFLVVAGESDQFVPPTSSLAPFDDGVCRRVPGNHLQIVKPADADSPSLKLLVQFLTGRGDERSAVAAAAAVAVECRRDHEVVERLLPQAKELDQRGAVDLALSLDRLGRRQEAVAVLERRQEPDALGTLGGRYKRLWVQEQRAEDGERAEELYRTAYERTRESNPAQAYYHAINLAFLALARGSQDDPERVQRAQALARQALEHCAQAQQQWAGSEPASQRWWRIATEAEAHLYLGDRAQALAGYRKALTGAPDPWQRGSTFAQAFLVSGVLEDEALGQELAALFDPYAG